MSKTIYLIRHCITKDSELGINGSLTDTPLSENGLIQARSLIPTLSKFNYDLIIISPLQRTKQTIQPYVDSLKLSPEIVVEVLTLERDLGLLTNSVNDDGQIPASILASGKTKTEWVPPQGESTIQVYLRAKRFLNSLKKRQKSHILICGHQNFLRCLEMAIKDIPINDDSFFSDSPPRMEFGELRVYQLN